MLKHLILERYPEIKKYGLLVLCYAGMDIGMLIVCNMAIVSLFRGDTEVRHFLFFILLVSGVLFFLNTTAKQSIRIIEGIVSDFRERIIKRVMSAELESFERMDSAGIYNILTRETQVISLIANRFIQITRVLIVTAGYLVILLFVYPPAFICVLICLGIGTAIYAVRIMRAKAQISRAREKEKGLFGAIEALLYGFKELKINDEKSDEFFRASFIANSARTRDARIKAENYFAFSNVSASFFQYVIFIPILFLLPLIKEIPSLGLMLTVNLLVFTPFDVLKEGIPYLVRAGVSIERIIAFEKRFTALKTETLPSATGIENFFEIKYENICFNYTDSRGTPVFSLKDIDLSIKKGEIIFIAGGNGSGKSTLLKIVTGLYFPLSGAVKIDGRDIETVSFRHLFTTIFSDFHLFDRLYGIAHPDTVKINEWLELMELSDKLDFRNGRFTTLDLSTGQRKRLAMIAAVMDDKPVYIFDEWAADQSPLFRDYFYRNLLPLLKSRGKTIIAVSHDDRYFDVADRVIELDYGRIRV